MRSTYGLFGVRWIGQDAVLSRRGSLPGRCSDRRHVIDNHHRVATGTVGACSGGPPSSEPVKAEADPTRNVARDGPKAGCSRGTPCLPPARPGMTKCGDETGRRDGHLGRVEKQLSRRAHNAKVRGASPRPAIGEAPAGGSPATEALVVGGKPREPQGSGATPNRSGEERATSLSASPTRREIAASRPRPYAIGARATERGPAHGVPIHGQDRDTDRAE